MTGASAGPVRSKWTMEEYRELVSHLLERGLEPLDLDGFEKQEAGLWLRHDVELSLDAAAAMAAVEADLGIPSTYFLCVESPFIAGDIAAINTLVERLLDARREVSFHIVLSPEVPSVEERLRAFTTVFPRVEPRALTFHAPGVPTEVLASAPKGAMVYEPLVRSICRYFSDSTGRWRWGDPRYSDSLLGSCVQLLTHPFWWFGTYTSAELPGGDAAFFLPQFTALERYAGMVARVNERMESAR